MRHSNKTAALRLDHYVAAQLPHLSRSTAAKLIEKGQVSVNGVLVQKSGYRLKVTDVVKISTELLHETPQAELELPIIYEDDDCVVVDKPLGVLTHSKGAFNPEATVATWLQPKLAGLSGERGGIVHRLDRATSGVMICAKTPEAMSWLQKQFAQRRVKKTYVAAVQGSLKPPAAVIDMPIERNPKQPQTFRTGSNGKPSITAYRQLTTSSHYNLIELKPETGRTHQLRVHLQKLGHPIVGDKLYGGAPGDRLFLHAQELEITLSNRQRQVFSVPVPAEFTELINNG